MIKRKALTLSIFALVSSSQAQLLQFVSINSGKSFIESRMEAYQESLDRKNKCGAIAIAIAWRKIFPPTASDIQMVESGQCGPDMQKRLAGNNTQNETSGEYNSQGSLVKDLAIAGGIALGTALAINWERANADQDWQELMISDRSQPDAMNEIQIAANYFAVAEHLSGNSRYSHKVDFIANGYSMAAYYYSKAYSLTGDDSLLYLAYKLMDKSLSYSTNDCTKLMSFQVYLTSGSQDDYLASLTNHFINQKNSITCQINDGLIINGPGAAVTIKVPAESVLSIADNAFDTLTDNYQWAIASEQQSVRLLQKYITKYSTGNHANDAKELLEQLIWNQSRDEVGLRQYLSLYPHGRFVDVANEKLDDITWSNIATSQDVEAFRSYLSLYPKGKHAREANKQIEAILFGDMVRNRQGLGVNLALSSSNGLSGSAGIDYSTFIGSGETYLAYGINFNASPKFNFSIGYDYWINRKISVGAGLSYDHELTYAQKGDTGEVGTTGGVWGGYIQSKFAVTDSLTIGVRYRKNLCATDACMASGTGFGATVGYKF